MWRIEDVDIYRFDVARHDTDSFSITSGIANNAQCNVSRYQPLVGLGDDTDVDGPITPTSLAGRDIFRRGKGARASGRKILGVVNFVIFVKSL